MTVFCSAPHAGSYALPVLSVVAEGVDGVFAAADPWPFIGLHYLQVGCQSIVSINQCF
jgi:hypothetical protein